MSAYLINHPNNDDKFICNICSSTIEQNKIIGLKCNVKKHIFCYDCIKDWYLYTKQNVKYNINSNYNFVRMCPICRKNGGYLPNIENKFISQIHLKSCTIIQTCGYKLKGKNDYCMNAGQNCYNNLCKKHYKIDLKKNNIEINQKETMSESRKIQEENENNIINNLI